MCKNLTYCCQLHVAPAGFFILKIQARPPSETSVHFLIASSSKHTVFAEKLIVAHLLQKFLTTYGPRKFINVLTKAHFCPSSAVQDSRHFDVLFETHFNIILPFLDACICSTKLQCGQQVRNNLRMEHMPPQPKSNKK
jgi:hypothetical protein